MTLHLSEDQRMLRDAAQRFLSQRHPAAVARAATRQDAQAQQALWRDVAEQGWPALLAPDAHGGLGLGMREAWIVAEEAGRHLLGLPLVSNMALLPTLCRAGGEAAQWAGPMMSGETWYAEASVRPDGSALIEGAGEGVRALAVREAGPAQVRLELLAPVPGVAGLDPTMPVAACARPGIVAQAQVAVAPGTWDLMRTRLRLLRTAEMLGAASAALDLGAAYARERQQFGRAIGANQAIKHRLAEDWMALDDARLAGWAAAAALDEDAAGAADGCLFAPLLAVDASRRAAQSAIQTHGALGVTWECDAHLYLKRVLRLSATLEAEVPAPDLLERIWRAAA